MPMMSRGRYSQTNEWDDSSVFEPQYLDADNGGDLNLDHCRLYIKNLPKGLNEAGLYAAFAKFGTLYEAYLSPDPGKNFALVKYETPGEAKLAMMKMNNTEPLKLQIQIAKKSKAQSFRKIKYCPDKSTNDVMERSDRSHGVSNRDREDSGSISSRGRHSRVQEDIPISDNNMEDIPLEDDYGFSDILDPNLHLELENLKLEQLKVREEQLQCKQRVILLKQAERKPMSQMSNRCILPDGKIVVRNVNERDSRDTDVNCSVGAGDSLKLPGLQRDAARQCVVCGSTSDAYCAGCGITPYCSERCQRRDWQERHSAVCHNLARLNNENAKAAVPLTRDSADNVPRLQPVTPLRRPHGNTSNNNREPKRENSAEAGFSNGGFKSKASVKSTGSNGKEDRFRHPILNRNVDKEKANEPVQATKPVSPTKVAPEPGNYRLPNTLDKAKKPELPAAAPAKQKLVPKTSIPDPPIVTPEAVKPQEAAPPPKESTPAVKPASVSDVTPIKKMSPKNYLLEKMSVGDSVMISVDANAADCRITRGDFVCLTMAGAFEEHYHELCEDFVLDCNKLERPAKLTPGETISYFNPEDCGWYRARCLNPTTLALLDSGRIVTVTAADKCRELPTKYEAIPEFCAVLACKTVKIGASLNCKILSQTPKGFKISMADVETDANLGEGEVFRWLPTVDYPATPVGIPEVARPPLTDGSKVLLVLADTLDKVFVRPADSESQRQYNDVLQQVLLSAMKAKPLTEPPTPGQTVIGKFVDDCHYRALVRRVNVKQNKYQIEYAEYGNIEVSTLENLYPCPPEFDLSNVKTQVSVLKLATPTDLSVAAKEYIQELMQDEELVLTIPDGRKSVPSGSEAALNVARNKVSVGAKLVEMCTPNWKKIEQSGGDVVGTEHIMFKEIKYTALPKEGCTVEVLDVSVFRGGAICGYNCADKNADMVFNQLTAKMADYCNSELGREPYLPKPEELCIAQLPPYPQWFRAVFLDLVSGPGSSEARLCFLDYGNIANVPVTLLRKMMPEFITGIPVMGLYMEIRGFPQDLPDETLIRGIKHMNIGDDGKGTLKVSNCVLQTDGIYLVDAPDLMTILKG